MKKAIMTLLLLSVFASAHASELNTSSVPSDATYVHWSKGPYGNSF